MQRKPIFSSQAAEAHLAADRDAEPMTGPPGGNPGPSEPVAAPAPVPVEAPAPARATAPSAAGPARSDPGPTLVSRIKAKLPLTEYASRHIKLKASPGSSGELAGKCPDPAHDDSTASFYVSAKNDAFHCHGCGISGNVIHLYALVNGMEYADAKLQLGRELGVFNERTLSGPESMLSNAARRYVEQLQRKDDAMKYLVEVRGLTAESIDRFGIGFCWGRECQNMTPQQKGVALATGLLKPATERSPEKSWMAGRITFPVRDRVGRIVGFAGRLVPSEFKSYGPKYLNTPETEYFRKSELLYGAYEAGASIASKGQAIVVEGYMDVVALHQCTVTNAVAVMGASANEATFANLWSMTKRVVFCLDGDAAGETGAMRSVLAGAPTMPDGGEIAIARLPAGVDPDEFVLKHGAEAFEALCRDAMPLSRFLMERGAADFDLSYPEGRSAFMEEARRVAGLFAAAPIVREQILAEARAINGATLVSFALSTQGVPDDAEPGQLRDAMVLIQRRLAALAKAAPASPATPTAPVKPAATVTALNPTPAAAAPTPVVPHESGAPAAAARPMRMRA